MKSILSPIAIVVLTVSGVFVLEGQDAPPPTRSPEPARALPAPAIPSSKPAGGGGYGGYGGAYGSAPSAGFSDRLQRIIKSASAGTPAPMPPRLIVRSSAMDAKEEARLTEDLAIMDHLLGKAVEDFGGNRGGMAMGIDVFGSPGASGSRSFYLEEYGALFILNCGMPLVAAQPRPEEKSGEPPVDSAWEEAKREVYGQASAPLMPGAPGEAFNAEKLQKLTDALIDALRNVKNIRGLRSDDAVTVCLLGTPAAPEHPGKEAGPGPVPPPRPNSAYAPPAPGWTALYTEGRPQQETVMTLRVKKTDADALAKGSIKPDEFRQKVRVERYQAGANTGPSTGLGAGGFGGGFGGAGGFGQGGRY